MNDAAAFWKHLNETFARMEYELNLTGKTTAKCTADRCDNGVTERGYTDYDGYGSIWRDAVHCRACGGRGRVEVPCGPEMEAAAIEKEIARLKARLKELRKVRKK